MICIIIHLKWEKVNSYDIYGYGIVVTMKYESVIGLEVHVELNTATKMFCYSLNDPDEKHPNINICPVCMGHPGTLPMINEEAVKKVIMVGLALGGTIPESSQFDRKNYFYPDLPKGYQISQYKHPLVSGGELMLSSRTIQIERVHLEEDAGRLIHDESGGTLVDFNRAGVPLMELVTKPDLRTSIEVREFGEELQRIVRYVGASDANMEKGQMRVEVNISLRPEGAKEFGTKVEVKNINSFKFAALAAEYEMLRQREVLERGEKVVHETRGWNEFRQETFSQRSKEAAHDYRYFPEPDLPPLKFTKEFVEGLRAHIPELPRAKQKRFIEEYGIASDIATLLVHEKALADYSEEVFSEALQHEKETPEQPRKSLIRASTSLLTGEFLRLLKMTNSAPFDTRVTPENFGELVVCIVEGTVSSSAARQVLEEMFRTGDDPSDSIDRLGLRQMSNTSDLEAIVRHIVEENPTVAADYRAGKQQVAQFLVGQIMKESRGTANPKIVQELLQKLLRL